LERFESVKEVILKNCKYQVPEITYTFIEGGNESYLSWLSAEVSSTSK
ncbi:divalent-cation tolerance protein CutA, partial [bacterium]|nr:divalent-cation tolerance protein CutA [bacterium]